MRISWLFSALFLFCVSQAHALTVLSSPLVLNFGPSGSDVTGNGTLAAPFRTPCGSYAYLAANYDINGLPVLIKATGPGTYDCSLSVNGRLRGHNGVPTLVTIQGAAPPDASKPYSLDPESVTGYIWRQVPGQGSAITVSYDALLYVEGFLFDKKNAVINGTFADQASIILNVGEFSRLWIGTVAFGFDSYPGAMVNGQYHASLVFRGNIGLFHPKATITAAGLDPASTTVAVSGIPSDWPLLAQQSVQGTGIAQGTYIASVNGSPPTSITLSQAPTSSQGSTPLSIGISSTSMVGLGNVSTIYTETGGINGRGYISATGNPHYVWGVLAAVENSDLSWAGVPWFQRETWQSPITYSGTQGSNIITVSGPVYFAAGFTAWTDAVPRGCNVTNVAGLTITLQYPLTRNVSNEPIRFGYQPFQMVGPAATIWTNATIVTSGTQAMLPGTAPFSSAVDALGAYASGGIFD